MTDIDFESKHPRQDGGKFAAKEGEAANVTLAAPEHEPVHARVVHQVWHGDYAVETGESTSFDARPVLDSMTLDELEELERSGDLFEVQQEATAFGHTPQPDGPSYTDILDLGDYIEQRRENGLTDAIAPLTKSDQRIDDDVKELLHESRDGLSVSIAVQAAEKEGFRQVIGTSLTAALEKYNDLDEDTRARMRENDTKHFKRIHDFLDGYGVKLASGATTYRPESQGKALELVAAIADYQFNRPDERPTE